MKQNEITTLPRLSNENFANFFNVSQKGNNYIYNINKTIYFDNITSLSPNYYEKYTIQLNDQWTTISFKFYGTIELWWIICKINNIKDPSTELIPGTIINIPSQDAVLLVLNNIKVN